MTPVGDREARDTDAALRELSRQTGWHCWQGVVPMFYARLPKSSPPKVLRASGIDTLREAIQRASTTRPTCRPGSGGMG
jgi:hypothetical protein